MTHSPTSRLSNTASRQHSVADHNNHHGGGGGGGGLRKNLSFLHRQVHRLPSAAKDTKVGGTRDFLSYETSLAQLTRTGADDFYHGARGWWTQENVVDEAQLMMPTDGQCFSTYRRATSLNRAWNCSAQLGIAQYRSDRVRPLHDDDILDSISLLSVFSCFFRRTRGQSITPLRRIP